MTSVPAVRLQIRLVAKLKKKGSLVRYQERDKNKIFSKISSRQTKATDRPVSRL